MSLEEEIQISKSAFQGMNNLRFLEVDCDMIRTPEGLRCLPNKLRLIHWPTCPLTVWPPNFSGKFLVELVMPNSIFEKLWEGIKPLHCLKHMDLSKSRYLKEIPDLTQATSLGLLDLSGCERLLELTSSIGKLTNLEELNLIRCTQVCSSLEKISGCSRLKEVDLSYTAIWEVPSSISSYWSCLYRLDMTECRNLKEFPNVPDSIVELLLGMTRIEEIPPRIENLTRLRELIMHGCQKLKKISPNISKLENLEFLGLCIGGKCEFDDVEEEKDYDHGLYEVVIEWGSDLKRTWRFVSDIRIDYILPKCLPMKTSSLCFSSSGLKTIPDCITRLSGLSKLDVKKCRKLVALPKLPGSLLFIHAEECESLKRINFCFQNRMICLNFSGCYNLNQRDRKLIHTSVCQSALVPGEKVPAHFPHQATSGSLTIDLTPTPLPSSFRFKACILLSKEDNLEDENLMMGGVSCCVRCKHNGLTIQYGSNQHHMPCQSDPYDDHFYIFEDSFFLEQDCPEAEEATTGELVFEFRGHGKIWKVKGCGVRLLAPDSIIDRIEEEYDDDVDESDDDGEGLGCLNLNQKAGKLIQTLDGKYVLSPGEQVAAHFRHKAYQNWATVGHWQD